MSLSRDDTHSWVRISHGSNKFVMDSNNNDTEVPEDQPEGFCMPIKGKSKTTKKRTGWLFTKNRSHGKKELDRC